MLECEQLMAYQMLAYQSHHYYCSTTMFWYSYT